MSGDIIEVHKITRGIDRAKAHRYPEEGNQELVHMVFR